MMLTAVPRWIGPVAPHVAPQQSAGAGVDDCHEQRLVGISSGLHNPNTAALTLCTYLLLHILQSIVDASAIRLSLQHIMQLQHRIIVDQRVSASSSVVSHNVRLTCQHSPVVNHMLPIVPLGPAMIEDVDDHMPGNMRYCCARIHQSMTPATVAQTARVVHMLCS